MQKHIERAGISVLSAMLAVAIVTLPGCGKEEHKKAATQVVAKVNGDEISVHQINYVLARSQGINAENVEQAKKEIVDKLIDQQLAIQQAEAAKLDRDPAVMQNIEASRRDILARAYLEKVATSQAKPTADETKKYYADHPELFAHRRVYNLREIALPADGVAAVKPLIAQNKSMQDIANALKAANIRFGANAGVRSAEQLPLATLGRLHEAKDGQTLLIESPQGAMVVQVVASQEQPVAESEALPKIEQFLANQRAGEVVANDMKKLRAQAKIEMVNEAAAAKPAPAAAPAAAPAPAPTAGAMDDKNVAKGVAGLK
jgi:EpsD family peptidyl-prolyl cis-trans isomerase